MAVYGAFPADWQTFIDTQHVPDMLPIVCNPNAIRSEGSKIQFLGKIPTLYNVERKWCGIHGWTSHKATLEQVNEWRKEPDYGICLQTNYVRAFDIDVPDRAKAEKIAQTIEEFLNIELPLRFRSNSGKALLAFQCQGDFRKKAITVDGGIIEFLATKNQFVAAGTHFNGEGIPSGARYEWDWKGHTLFPEISQTLAEKVWQHVTETFAIEKPKEKIAPSLTSHFQAKTTSLFKKSTSPDSIISDRLSQLATATSGKRNIALNETAFVIGKCLAASGWAKQDIESELLAIATNLGLDYSESVATIASGLTSGEAAPYQYGKKNDNAGYQMSYTTPPDTPHDEDGVVIESFPASVAPLELEGLIGDTVRWICRTAIIVQPELALLNTLAFAGAVFGRRYALASHNTRTNLYMVGIAKTGHGKDHSRKAINRLANEAKLSVFIGANWIRSGAGLAQSMEKKASQVLQIDEFGLFLQSLSNPKAPAYLREVSKMLMTLYSDSSGVYHHGVLADKKTDPIVLVQPALSIYGTSTLKEYTAALKTSAIESGNLNRFIVLPSKQKGEIKRDFEQGIPEDIVNIWRSYALDFPSGDNPCDMAAPIIPVLCEDEQTVADKIYTLFCEAFEKSNTRRNGLLWNRCAENSLKIAMVFAIARDGHRPRITVQDIELGESIVTESITYMDMLACEHMAENELESDKLEVLAFIKEGSKKRSDILRKFRKLKTRDLDDMVSSLVEEGAINVEEQEKEGTGRKGQVFSAHT